MAETTIKWESPESQPFVAINTTEPHVPTFQGKPLITCDCDRGPVYAETFHNGSVQFRCYGCGNVLFAGTKRDAELYIQGRIRAAKITAAKITKGDPC